MEGTRIMAFEDIRFKKLHPSAKVPMFQTPYSAAADIYALEYDELTPNTTKLIRTGIAFDFDDFHYAYVLPRSGLAAKHGITVVNAPGLIDSDYKGELKVILWNFVNQYTFQITPGMRIAQIQYFHRTGEVARAQTTMYWEFEDFTGMKNAQGFAYEPKAKFSAVVSSTTERGEGGFGSTGV